MWERYPGGNWGYLNLNSSTLAPAPEGAVATMRYEMLREGAQECEARILIEGVLGDAALKNRLGTDLVKECEATLDERRVCLWRSLIQYQSGPSYRQDVNGWREGGWVTGYLWFLGSGWQERSARPFGLAGEVQKRPAVK